MAGLPEPVDVASLHGDKLRSSNNEPVYTYTAIELNGVADSAFVSAYPQLTR